MQYFKEIIVLVTALIGLVTAIYAYRSTRFKEISSCPASNVKLIRIVGEPIKKWKWRLLQGLLVLWTLFLTAILVISIFLLREMGIVAVWILVVNLIWVPLYAFSLWKLLRRRPWEVPSLVRRNTRVEVQAEFETVFSQCEIALRKMGARITSLDRQTGVIEARKALSWTSAAAKLAIAVKPAGGKSCIIAIESDSVLPTAVFDFGTNRRNVERFIEHLVS